MRVEIEPPRLALAEREEFRDGDAPRLAAEKGPDREAAAVVGGDDDLAGAAFLRQAIELLGIHRVVEREGAGVDVAAILGKGDERGGHEMRAGRPVGQLLDPCRALAGADDDDTALPGSCIREQQEQRPRDEEGREKGENHLEIPRRPRGDGRPDEVLVKQARCEDHRSLERERERDPRQHRAVIEKRVVIVEPDRHHRDNSEHGQQ